MKTKTLLFTGIICFGLIFQGCEKDDPDTAFGKSQEKVKVENKVKLETNTKDKALYTFSSESELKTYLETLPSESKVEYKKQADGTYVLQNLPFNGNDVLDPPDPSMVWLFPSQWDEAWAEAQDMMSTGCLVTMTFGYGMVAVNIDC